MRIANLDSANEASDDGSVDMTQDTPEANAVRSVVGIPARKSLSETLLMSFSVYSANPRDQVVQYAPQLLFDRCITDSRSGRRSLIPTRHC